MEKLVNMVPYSDSPRGGVQSQVDALNSSLAKLYPIGSIYLSVNSTNPSTFIGGTWERLKDRFLLAAGDTYTAGSTGGEARHKLTISELPDGTIINRNPSKRVGLPFANKSVGYVEPGTWIFASNYDFQQNEGVTLSNQPHNNMPPYIAVYMWVRTA